MHQISRLHKDISDKARNKTQGKSLLRKIPYGISEIEEGMKNTYDCTKS